VVATGRRALVVLAHADVLVENPQIARLAAHEIDKYRRFCEGRGIDIAVRVPRPAFWDSFAVRVLGGRALPTFPDARRDCTTDWKRLANTRELATLWRELAKQAWREPVLMTGVRRDESVARALSIANVPSRRSTRGPMRMAACASVRCWTGQPRTCGPTSACASRWRQRLRRGRRCGAREAQ
jgi:3'-phosphoadenosine 5'-phosphosulfate sulfotransferase (PAPS reductase)/FAD synthetase